MKPLANVRTAMVDTSLAREIVSVHELLAFKGR